MPLKGRFQGFPVLEYWFQTAPSGGPGLILHELSVWFLTAPSGTLTFCIPYFQTACRRSAKIGKKVESSELNLRCSPFHSKMFINYSKNVRDFIKNSRNICALKGEYRLE